MEFLKLPCIPYYKKNDISSFFLSGYSYNYWQFVPMNPLARLVGERMICCWFKVGISDAFLATSTDHCLLAKMLAAALVTSSCSSICISRTRSCMWPTALVTQETKKVNTSPEEISTSSVAACGQFVSCFPCISKLSGWPLIVLKKKTLKLCTH